MVSDPFRAALLLAEAFQEEGHALSPIPRPHQERLPYVDMDTPEGHYAHLSTTGVILLYVVGDTTHDLEWYDSMFETVGATRVNVEPDGPRVITVFTYRVPQ